jgi:hypothetical protein
MKTSTTAIIAGLALGAVAGGIGLSLEAALAATRQITFDGAKAQLKAVQLERLADAGIAMTVYARVDADADAGFSIDRPQTCVVGSLTPAERACLISIRDASLACWLSKESL